MGCSSYSAAAQTFYRRIFTFTADDPQPLVEGGTACMRLTVHGQVRCRGGAGKLLSSTAASVRMKGMLCCYMDSMQYHGASDIEALLPPAINAQTIAYPSCFYDPPIAPSLHLPCNTLPFVAVACSRSCCTTSGT